MNVLVVAPHPDDEAIGCGGTICIHADRGNRVTAVFLTSGEFGLPDLPEAEARSLREREAEDSAGILGISSVAFLRQQDYYLAGDVGKAAEALGPILHREMPEVIYLTHDRDWHPDHRATVQIVETALQAGGIPAPSLRGYEVQTPLAEYDLVENISVVMKRKMAAVRAHRSQVRQFRYDRAVRALNEFRGTVAQAGRYAEVFRFADSCVSGVAPARRADPAWHRLQQATQYVTRLVPPGASFILVDDGQLEAQALVAPRRCIPFLEKDGSYWGKPPDSRTAICELERLRATGASFIVFAWPAFWWLDYYSGLRRRLHEKYSCVFKDANLIIFDLLTSLTAGDELLAQMNDGRRAA